MRVKHLRMPVAAILAASVALFSGYAAPRATPQPKVELTVSAAISLKDALDEIAQLYSTEMPGSVIHFNLGGSGTLQHQIEQGAPVDVFISASEDQMNSLESEGLLAPGTRRNLVKNTVVLIVPKGKSGISSFQDLQRPEVKEIAIGDPQTVPAGKYAEEVLTHFQLYEQLKPKLVLTKDVRQVLTYVITGNVDAGIVYATDAKISAAVRVVATAPESSHAPVVYPVATLKASKQPADAKRFLGFLMSAKAQGVFEKYGFKPAGE